MYLDSMNLPSLQKKKKKKKKKVTENRGSENVWLKIRARPKLARVLYFRSLMACNEYRTIPD